MGNAPTKVMPATAFPTTVVPPLNLAPARRVAYRLPITLTVAPFEEDAPLEHDHIQEALGLAFFTGVWQPYLHSAMEEAWLIHVNQGKDGEKDEIVVPCPELNTKCTLVVLEKTAEPGVYSGFVCWKSRAIPLEFVQRTLEWYVGDRMSSYEIQADQWGASICIGEVTCE